MTRVNQPLCKVAAEAIITAFTWSFTKEGHEYWSEVHQKLNQLAGETDEAHTAEQVD